MNIDLVPRSQDLTRTSLLVLGAFHDGTLTPAAEILSEKTRARLSALVAAGELKRHVGAQLQLFGLAAALHRKILLVALGPRGELSETAYRAVLVATARTMAESLSREAVVTLTEVAVAGRSLEWRIEQAARHLADGAYRFTLPSRGDNQVGEHGVERVALLVPGAVEPAHEAAARRGLAIAEGLALAKDLGNMPANLCTPAYLADTARSLGSRFDFAVEIFGPADLEKLGMEALLSVGRQDHAAARLIVMGYRGAAASKPVVLAGQGLTFDGGGASLRPGAALHERKFDMSGAGAVLGTLWAVARLCLPLSIIGLLPAAEITAGAGRARPGDLVRSMSGLTIELVGPDAAGRLILCDALSYAQHLDPACVIDVAMLSSASAVALGSHASGLFANDDELAQELLESGIESGDRAWQLPLWDDYQSALASTVADVSNLGGPMAEAVTAACFLSRFAGRSRWAHLDITGTASLPDEGATGRPVPLLTTFLTRRARKGRSGQARRDAPGSGPPPRQPTRIS